MERPRQYGKTSSRSCVFCSSVMSYGSCSRVAMVSSSSRSQRQEISGQITAPRGWNAGMPTMSSSSRIVTDFSSHTRPSARARRTGVASCSVSR